MKTIAIQGEQASFHDVAARQFFGNNIKTINCQLPFKNVFKKLQNTNYAVVAIENSLYGSINEVYDLLLSSNAVIVGEIYLKVELCLIGIDDVKLQDITEVHSHPVALSECEDYLDSALSHSQRFEHFDTAGSVADIKKWNDKTKVAIASAEAAKLHNLIVLAKNIETHPENYTRFVVLSKNNTTIKKATKASLIMQTADKPGALYEALGHFAKRKINLSKIESRPIIGQAWQYMFYVDVVSDNIRVAIPLIIKDLQNSGCKVQLLGIYEKASNIY